MRKVGLWAIAAAIGAATAATVIVVAHVARLHRADLALHERAQAVSTELSRRVMKLEVAGAVIADRLRSADADTLPTAPLAEALSAQQGIDSLSGAPALGVEISAVALFEIAATPLDSHRLLDAFGPDQAAARAAVDQLARLDDGKLLLRAARRSDVHGALSAIINLRVDAPEAATGSAAEAGGRPLSKWLLWTLKDTRRAVVLRIKISPRAADVSGIDVLTLPEARLTPAPQDLRGAQAAAEVAFGDKASRVVVKRSPPPWHALSPLEFGATAGGGLAMMLFFAWLLSSRRARSEAQAEHAREIAHGIAAKERALEASEARFQHLAESTNVIPWTADLDRQSFTYVGPQIEDLTGFPASQWTVPGFWADHVHPADRARVLGDELPRLSLDRYHTIEYRLRAADGMVLNIRNMLTVVEDVHEIDGRRITRTQAQGFILDITELKRAAEALEVAREKAEDANRIKSEFLANMSHELRTPLNAVIGFSEIMKDQLFGPLDPQYQEYATSIHSSGRHLLDLINDVLDLSKIEAGRFELSEEETDLAGLLNECVVLLQERMQSAGLHGRHAISADLPAMVLDERRIKQVILNLLSNAIKFTPPGGAVGLTAEARGEQGVMVSVRDTGIGMSAEEIPRALTKFGQIDGDLSRSHDGTGLGLPIAKSLIEMHGGRLEVLSEKGKGTEMRLWLPAARMSAQAA